MSTQPSGPDPLPPVDPKKGYPPTPEPADAPVTESPLAPEAKEEENKEQ